MGGWQPLLIANIKASGTTLGTTVNLGVSGETVASALAVINTKLSVVTPTPDKMTFLLNWGVNDVAGGLPVQATFQNNYIAILDAIIARWPNAIVYLMRPWNNGGSDFVTLGAWIGNVQAARSAFTFLGPDEKVWLKGADNGVAETIDGTHYSALGNTLAAKQWQTTLGY